MSGEKKTRYDLEKPGIWLNIYVLFMLVWSGRLLETEPQTFMWWFYLVATVTSAIGAGIQFVIVLATSSGRKS